MQREISEIASGWAILVALYYFSCTLLATFGAKNLNQGKLVEGVVMKTSVRVLILTMVLGAAASAAVPIPTPTPEPPVQTAQTV